jgi:hypothetical protein
MGATPQLPRNLPGNDPAAQIRALERRIALLEQRSPFTGTGLSAPAANTTQVDGNLTVVGTFTALGKVSNDALVNPVVPAQAFQGASTFSLTVAGGNIVTITRNTPAGFTSVVVNAYGRVAAINSTASPDALYCAVDVNGSGGNQFGMPVNAGSFGSLSAGYSTLLTGLSTGSPVAVHLFASTGAASWASNVANGADLSVTFLWFR